MRAHKTETDGKEPEHPERGRGPWTCRWASIAGSVRSIPSVASPDVIWTCDLRNRSTETLLFHREACEQCGRWEALAACAPTAAAPRTLTLLLPNYARPSPVIARTRRYERGERIFDEGATTDLFYTTISGSVKLVKTARDGHQSIVGIASGICPLNPDGIDGGRSSSASAVALDDTTCVLVPKKQLLALFEERPGVALRLYREVCENLESSFTRLTELSRGTVENRLAKLFLGLARSAGHERDGALFIPIRLSRQELADSVGTSIETCIRLMSRWGKRRFICTSTGGFVVRDTKMLELLAEDTIAHPHATGRAPARNTHASG